MNAARRSGQRTDFAAAADRARRTGTASQKPAAQVRTTPVRITLDLDPDLYDRLQRLRRRIGVDVDANVTQADLSRVLYRLLLDSPDLQEQVRAKLEDEKREAQ